MEIKLNFTFPLSKKLIGKNHFTYNNIKRISFLDSFLEMMFVFVNDVFVIKFFRIFRVLKISHYLTNGISLLFHRWEQQDITDGCCVSEKHAETVDTDSESTCWWHTVFESFNVVVVDACCFVVTEFFSSSLCFET